MDKSGKTFDIFLSYPREEREWVRRLADALAEHGLRAWYAEAEIMPGELWAEGLEEGLRSSTYFVSVVTPESAQSNWAAWELGAALGLHKPIIPIVAADVPFEVIPDPVKRRRYIPKTDPAAVAEEIAHSIAGKRKTEKVPA